MDDTEGAQMTLITDPALRAAFMAAHYAWAKKYAPHLLQQWVTK